MLEFKGTCNGLERMQYCSKFEVPKYGICKICISGLVFSIFFLAMEDPKMHIFVHFNTSDIHLIELHSYSWASECIHS